MNEITQILIDAGQTAVEALDRQFADDHHYYHCPSCGRIVYDDACHHALPQKTSILLFSSCGKCGDKLNAALMRKDYRLWRKALGSLTKAATVALRVPTGWIQPALAAVLYSIDFPRGADTDERASQ